MSNERGSGDFRGNLGLRITKRRSRLFRFVYNALEKVFVGKFLGLYFSILWLFDDVSVIVVIC